ncbi:MAG TPA: hypothetical protein VHF22_12335, partial [Planctomycetota bacterium]|nr:hypothetical protein [Planctomycetota bacterium]
MDLLTLDVQAFLAGAAAEFGAAGDEAGFEKVRVKYLGRKGGLVMGLLEQLKGVPKEQKGALGKRANEVKAAVEGLA